MDDVIVQSISGKTVAPGDGSGSSSAVDTSDARNFRAFAVLVALLAIVNSWPLVVSLIDWMGWPMAMPDSSQWENRVAGLWVADSILMPIWLCLSTPRFRTRLLAAAFAFCVLRMTMFGARRATTPFVEPMWLWIISDLVFILSLSAVLAYFRYSRAWQLVGPERYGVVPQRRAVRFSLLQVFIATAVVGVLMALRLRWEIVGTSIYFMIAGQVVALVVVPTLALMLALHRTRAATLTDIGILIAMAGLVAWVARRPVSDLVPILTAYATIVTSCVWLRICRLRLIGA